jgi:hypothetical protein
LSSGCLVELALSGRDQESIVIDAWTTGAERQQDVIDGLLELFKRFRSSAGFVEARILKGSGGTTVVSYLRMRSAADQQRLDEQPEIQAGLEGCGRSLARTVTSSTWSGSSPPVRRRAGFPLAWGVLVRSAGDECSVGAAQGSTGRKPRTETSAISADDGPLACDVRSQHHHQPAEHQQHERVPHDGFVDVGRDSRSVPPDVLHARCNRHRARHRPSDRKDARRKQLQETPGHDASRGCAAR